MEEEEKVEEEEIKEKEKEIVKEKVEAEEKEKKKKIKEEEKVEIIPKEVPFEISEAPETKPITPVLEPKPLPEERLEKRVADDVEVIREREEKPKEDLNYTSHYDEQKYQRGSSAVIDFRESTQPRTEIIRTAKPRFFREERPVELVEVKEPSPGRVEEEIIKYQIEAKKMETIGEEPFFKEPEKKVKKYYGK